jgi:hypothetical protein
MRRLAIAAIPLLALLLVPGGASAARGRHAAPAKCRPGHSRQIAANAHAQLYLAPEPHALPEYLGVYGCVYGRHRPIFLGGLPDPSSQGDEGIQHATLAGSMAAYEEFFIGGYGSERAERRVVVRDLRSGRVLHRVPNGTPPTPEPGGVGIGNVVSLVVKSDGAVAWIAGDGEVVSPSNPSVKVSAYQVEAVDASGNRLLASGAEIDPHSLRLAGSTLYWTQEGKTMSATLD